MISPTYQTNMNRIEEIAQAKVIKWSHRKAIRDQLPALRWLYHTPNGGLRNAVVAMQMVALGVKKGVPDLILPVAMSCFTGLVIEMKSDTGTTFKEQAEWMEHYKAQGWSVKLCRSAEEAHQVLCKYLGADPAAVALE